MPRAPAAPAQPRRTPGRGALRRCLCVGRRAGQHTSLEVRRGVAGRGAVGAHHKSATPAGRRPALGARGATPARRSERDVCIRRRSVALCGVCGGGCAAGPGGCAAALGDCECRVWLHCPCGAARSSPRCEQERERVLPCVACAACAAGSGALKATIQHHHQPHTHGHKKLRLDPFSVCSQQLGLLLAWSSSLLEQSQVWVEAQGHTHSGHDVSMVLLLLCVAARLCGLCPRVQGLWAAVGASVRGPCALLAPRSLHSSTPGSGS
jgi:hypothetical protein